MIDGSIDISYREIKAYLDKVKEKEGICMIFPAGRFYITKNGIRFADLVCKDMGGKSTGIGAEYCENCISKEK